MKRTSLVIKMITLVVSLLIVSLGVYATYILMMFRQDSEKYVQDVTQNLTETQGERLTSELTNITNLIRSLRVLVSTQSSQSVRMDIAKVMLGSRKSVEAFGLFHSKPSSWKDPKSVFLFFIQSSLSAANSTKALSLETLAEALAQESPNRAWPERRIFSFKDHLLLYERFDKGGEIYSLAVIDPAFFKDQIQGMQSATAWVVLKPQTVLAESQNAKGKTPNFEISDLMKRSGVDIVSQVITENARQWYLTGLNLNSDFMMISKVPREAAFISRDKLLRKSIFMAALIVGIGIISGVLFSRSLTRPLANLTKAAEDVAAGNYAIHLDIRTQDEVGDLARSFNTLGERLSAREQELEKVTELAIRDGMTGLYNNRYFKQRLNECLSLARRSGQDLALLVIDVDFFKKFNDTYGHQQGDEVIKSLAKLLKDCARDTDIPARYGGEEFCIICPDTDANGGALFAERVRKAYEAMPITNINDGSILKSTCSIGVSSFKTVNPEKIEQLIEAADANLYKAKRGGRNQVVAS